MSAACTFRTPRSNCRLSHRSRTASCRSLQAPSAFAPSTASKLQLTPAFVAELPQPPVHRRRGKLLFKGD